MELMKTRPVFVAGSSRTPFVKARTHFKSMTNIEMLTAAMDTLAKKLQLQNKILGDVAVGAVLNGSNHWYLARESVLGTCLNPHTPGYMVQRACGTSLEATNQIALKIANYQIDDGIAGGVDTYSYLPITIKQSLANKLFELQKEKSFYKKIQRLLALRPADFALDYPSITEPRTHLSMGQHCEKMVQEWQISRQAQDELALISHQNAERAYQEGFYDDLVFELNGIKKDTIIRADSTLEKLATLKTQFDFSEKGTLTAGNSSPLTDGAAAVYLTSGENAKRLGINLLARFIDAEVAAVDFVAGEGLLMAPTIAVSRLLQRHKLHLQDFDFYEIHEAFAGQLLCTLKAWESDEYCKRVLHRPYALGSIDLTKLNIHGGSVALGHPFAATGARIVGSLAKMLFYKGNGRGLISICTAGGMGIAAILETI